MVGLFPEKSHMYVYVCVCMYIYTYYICIYTHLYIFTHPHMCINTHLYIVYIHTHIYIFFNFFLLLIPEREEGREKEREKHWYERETSISCLLHTPWPGTEPATQACALTRNRTCDLSVCRMTPNQLSHTSQGPRQIFLNLKSIKNLTR